MAEPVAIGVDVGGTKLVAATLTASGQVVERGRRQTPAGDGPGILAGLRALVAELGAGLPVGVGIAGLVTPEGVVRYSPNVDVRDLDVAGGLAAASPWPVAVVNDASAATLGEQRAGAARDRRHVIMLTLGTGVGGGVVVEGQLLLGTHGFAGELGHIVIEEGGRRCPCGNRGCLEAYASGSAIGRVAAERLDQAPPDSPLRAADEITGKAVTHAAAAGDPMAREVIEEAGRWLGVALAGLVNALDPEVVLVGGGAAAETAPWLLPAARTAMAARLLGTEAREPPPVELADLGDDAGMVGAGLLAADRAGTSG